MVASILSTAVSRNLEPVPELPRFSAASTALVCAFPSRTQTEIGSASPSVEDGKNRAVPDSISSRERFLTFGNKVEERYKSSRYVLYGCPRKFSLPSPYEIHRHTILSVKIDFATSPRNAQRAALLKRSGSRWFLMICMASAKSVTATVSTATGREERVVTGSGQGFLALLMHSEG